ncbi:FAD binding domain-containing protein [Candidatus Bipolaricaulota sp. J31]
MSLKRYHYARDVEEALSLLAAYEGRGAILAGGVDLARGLAPEIEGLIDITTAGLSGISRDGGGVVIGATATLEEIRRSREVRGYLGGFLSEVMGRVATLPLRNMATLGGAVVSAHPWADVPTALVALGAEVRWRTEERVEKAPIEELYRRPFRAIFRRSVLTEIRLPPWDGAFAFEKLSRNAGDIALINCACGLGLDEVGKIAWARVVVGATPYRATRLPGVEELLVGESPSSELWAAAARAAEREVRVGDDMRASAEWRRAVVPVIVRRALERAANAVMGDR